MKIQIISDYLNLAVVQYTKIRRRFNDEVIERVGVGT